MRQQFIWMKLAVLLAGCNLQFAATAVPTLPPTATASATQTQTQTATAPPTTRPTETMTATATAIPSNTPMPEPSHTPTITTTPSVTPLPQIPFRPDQLDLIDIPAEVQDGIDNPLIVFINSNDQATIANIATAQPENTTQVIYFTAPGVRNGRIPIAEVDASTGNQIYLTQTGKALAYFQSGGGAAGLYILNLQSTPAFEVRIWQTTSLIQRGIFSAPVWTADGEQLAITLQTGYALDIFLYARDGDNRVNLTDSGSYDMWPAFSSDGRYMAFVSDRVSCPSWNPADANACDITQQDPPTGGIVHLYDLQSGEVRQLADVFVTEPPRWINNNLLVFAGGDQNDLLNPQRTLWLANIATNDVRQVQLRGDDDNVIYLSDTWAPDGSLVLFQRVTASENEIIMMSADGEVIRRRGEELSFPRFGMRAAWSAIGERVAVGGSGGQCPYGIRVAESNFDWVATSAPPPSMCDPLYSAGGGNMAFTGINPNVDGRVDVYSATANGFGAQNLTVDLRGIIELIGWVGG